MSVETINLDVTPHVASIICRCRRCATEITAARRPFLLGDYDVICTKCGMRAHLVVRPLHIAK